MANTARTARICDAAIIDDGRSMDNRLVHIGVVNDGRIHAHHSSVVREASAAPLAACKADAHVSKSVVDAAVVADVLSPIAIMEEIMSAFKAPVGRRPEIAGLGGGNPCAGYPVVAVVAISPVARGPQITIFRAWWLLIYR